MEEARDTMTFLAIRVNPMVSQSTSARLAPMRAAFPEVLWEHPADYHITLRFFGRCSDAQNADLIRQLEQAAPQASSHCLQVGELGFFPPRHHRAVLWVGVTTSPPSLVALARQLEVWARDLGFAPDAKPFVPHITVARCSVREFATLSSQISAFKCPEPDTWRVTHYALMVRRRERTVEQGEPVYGEYCAVPLHRSEDCKG